MNIISTGAFQTEMDASNKQPTLAEKFAAVSEKKNAKAARAGGVSLMALSLAACGSDDATTTATTTTTTTTTVSATPVASAFTVAADALTGGAGNDTFTATKSSVLNNTDTVTGSTGTDSIVMEDIAGTLQLTSTGVENITVSPQTASATLSLKNMSGVESITIVNGDEGLDITNVSDLTTTFVLDGVTANKTVEVQAKTTSTEGTADSISFTVADSGSSANDSTIIVSDATNGTSTSTIETVNVEMAGSTTSYITVDADAASMNITGAGNAQITVQTATATISAAAATGNATIVTAAASSTVTGGAGDDTIKITDSSGDVVDGGAGKDTVSLMNAAAISKTGSYSNIEVVDIAATNTAVASIDVDTDWAGITEFTISGSATASGEAITIDDAPSGGTLNVMSTDTDVAATYDLKTDGATDSLTVNLGSASVAATVAKVVADDPETVNLVAGGKDGQDTNALTILDATTLNISGDGNTDLGNVSMATGGAVTVDGSAATGNLTFTMVNGAGASESVTITGGSGSDTITLEANSHDALDSVNLGLGTDKVTMTGITAMGAITDYTAETVALTLGNAGAALTTDARLSTIGKLDLNAGTLGENLSLTSLSGDTKVRLINFDDTGAADTVTLNYASATNPTVVLSQFGLNDSAGANGESLTITGTTAATLKMADAITGDTETVFINTLNVNTLTGLTMNLAGAAAEIAAGDIGGAVDIDTLTAAALTSLTMTSTSDNANAINIDAASTDASLTTIDASGMAGGGDVSLGTGASIVGRAGTATITLGSGDDTLSFSATDHASNVIDMGTNTTTTAAEDGDLLSFGGVITGNTVIDLSSTTDQISTLNAAANAAVQKGIDSVNLDNVTVASGTITITGSSTVNHITGSAGADVITGGEGADQINGKEGANTIVLTETTAAIDAITYGGGVDTISGYATDSDTFTVDVSALEAQYTVDLVYLDDQVSVALANTTESVSFHSVTATTSTNNMNNAVDDVVLALTVGTYGSTGAVETALEASGSEAIAAGNITAIADVAINDAYMILYNDTSGNAHLGLVTNTAALDVSTTTAYATGKLTITDIAVFNSTTVSALDAGDITFVA
jgi:hypothetical protein